MLLAMDVEVVAAIIGIATGVVGATVGLAKLGIKFVARRPPRLTVHARENSADRQGFERYITVVAAHTGPRPNTVVDMGLRLDDGERIWSINDGHTSRELPAQLEDGGIVTMTWL